MHLLHYQWCPSLSNYGSALASEDPRRSAIWVCVEYILSRLWACSLAHCTGGTTVAHCTGGTTGLHHKLETSVLFNEPLLRHLLDLSLTTSPGTTASNHHFCSPTLHLRRLDQPGPGPTRTTFRRPGAGAAADDLTHQQFGMLFSGQEQLGAVISAAWQRLGYVISSGPTIQLGAVISATRLRLGCVILALALLCAAVQRHRSSGPTIQLGAVIPGARLRLGCVVLALVLKYTVVQRERSSGPTIRLGAVIYQRVFSIGQTQLGSVIPATRLRLVRVMFQSPQTDSSLCTSTFITPKEAGRVRHDKLVSTKIEPSLDPDDYISM